MQYSSMFQGVSVVSLSDFDDSVVANVLSKCCPHELGSLATVCKRWHRLCTDDKVVRAAFLKKWQLDDIDGYADPLFLRGLRFKDFVQVHDLRRGETMLGLAFKYNTSEVALRVRNNLLSERALSSHTRVFVPVTDREQLRGKRLRVLIAGGMRRMTPVVYDGAFPEAREQLRGMGDPATVLQIKAKALQQELHLHEGFAKYYVNESEGDLAAARALHEEDEVWESSAAGRRMKQLYRQRHAPSCALQCGSWARYFLACAPCLGPAACCGPRRYDRLAGLDLDC